MRTERDPSLGSAESAERAVDRESGGAVKTTALPAPRDPGGLYPSPSRSYDRFFLSICISW